MTHYRSGYPFPSQFLAFFPKDIQARFKQSKFSDEHDPSAVETAQWQPHVDVHENDQSFLITADIPGVDPKTIDITMEKGVLTVKGIREKNDERDEKGYSRRERFYGSFYRRFALPDTADAENISASGKNGVLEITIPKKLETKSRKIEVQ